MPGGSRHAPGPRQAHSRAGSGTDDSKIADAIRPVVTASGLDLESVRVSVAGRRRLLRVVVDGDRGVSLDDAAAVSRELSAALDKTGVMGDFPYTLEVSSPGVDRPLTEPRHWRRATGRLVKVQVAGSVVLVGRVVLADDEAVILDVDGTRSRFPYAELGAGAIQVEFGRLQPEQEEPEQEEPEQLEEPEEPELGASRDGH
jgi:ribosome maturation factor RimP